MTILDDTDSAPQTQLSLFDDNLTPYNIVRIPLSKTGKHAGKYETIVDAVDADLAGMWWAVINMHKPSQHAIHTAGGRKNRKRFWMHRVIMERILGRLLNEDELVDHINGNGLDNRRQNIRLATTAQNNVNSRRRSDNVSGHKGVYWRKDKKKWCAEIHAYGKKTRLGYFDTLEDAHQAYCRAAKELHGEFARLE